MLFFLFRFPTRSWEERLWLCLFMITIASPSTTSLVKSNCQWTQWIWDSPLRNGKTWKVLRRKRWIVWWPSVDLNWNSYNEIEMKPRYYFSSTILFVHSISFTSTIYVNVSRYYIKYSDYLTGQKYRLGAIQEFSPFFSGCPSNILFFFPWAV